MLYQSESKRIAISRQALHFPKISQLHASQHPPVSSLVYRAGWKDTQGYTGTYLSKPTRETDAQAVPPARSLRHPTPLNEFAIQKLASPIESAYGLSKGKNIDILVP